MAVYYTTAADVRDYCKITYEDLGFADEATYTAFIEGLINIAERIIDDYCGVPSMFFKAGGLTFTEDLYDFRCSLSLRHKPIISIEKVEVNTAGYGQTPSWVQLETKEYIADLQAGIIHFISKFPATELQSVRVTYTAGFTETPQTVGYVAIQFCSNVLHAILQRKISPAVRVDDWTIRVLIPEAFTPELKNMLAPYVRRAVSIG